MTTLRKDVMDLQIMRGVSGLYRTEEQAVRDKAFEELESLRRRAPYIDYDKELGDYREEKYGEDCLQMECAMAFHADCIITRNKEDFRNSKIPCIEPNEFHAICG